MAWAFAEGWAEKLVLVAQAAVPVSDNKQYSSDHQVCLADIAYLESR